VNRPRNIADFSRDSYEKLHLPVLAMDLREEARGWLSEHLNRNTTWLINTRLRISIPRTIFSRRISSNFHTRNPQYVIDFEMTTKTGSQGRLISSQKSRSGLESQISTANPSSKCVPLKMRTQLSSIRRVIQRTCVPLWRILTGC
jgi:hypothetical protein